jgi:hypothetical protein
MWLISRGERKGAHGVRGESPRVSPTLCALAHSEVGKGSFRRVGTRGFFAAIVAYLDRQPQTRNNTPGMVMIIHRR